MYTTTLKAADNENAPYHFKGLFWENDKIWLTFHVIIVPKHPDI